MSTLVTSGSAQPQWLPFAPRIHALESPSPGPSPISYLCSTGRTVSTPSEVEAKTEEFWKIQVHLTALATSAIEVYREQKLSIRHFENHLDLRDGTLSVPYLLLHHRLTCKKMSTEYLQADQLRKVWREHIKPHLFITDTEVTLSIAESFYESVNSDSLAWSAPVENIFKHFPGLAIEKVCEIWKKIKITIESLHYEDNISYRPVEIPATSHYSRSSSSSSTIPSPYHTMTALAYASPAHAESTPPTSPQATRSSTDTDTASTSSDDNDSEKAQKDISQRVQWSEAEDTDLKEYMKTAKPITLIKKIQAYVKNRKSLKDADKCSFPFRTVAAVKKQWYRIKPMTSQAKKSAREGDSGTKSKRHNNTTDSTLESASKRSRVPPPTPNFRPMSPPGSPPHLSLNPNSNASRHDPCNSSSVVGDNESPFKCVHNDFMSIFSNL